MAEVHESLLQEAMKQSRLADHMLYVTYPLVQETKFLLAIIEHITNATRFAVQALLEYEVFYKRIEPYNKSFVSEISIYKNKVAPRYKLDQKYFKLMQKLQELQKFDKETNIKFKKGEKYILSTSEFSRMSVLDAELAKRCLNLSKKFIEEVAKIIRNAQT